MRARVPLVKLGKPEDVFELRPSPGALLVDVEGTLTDFDPSDSSIVQALRHFDELAKHNGIDLRRVHYVTNALLHCGAANADLSGRFHFRAHKPLFTPPLELRDLGRKTLVLGDQPLTDGLLAWRFGLSFGLVVSPQYHAVEPRVQRLLGRAISPFFFRVGSSAECTQ